MVANDIRICQKMKNKGQLSIEKELIKTFYKYHKEALGYPVIETDVKRRFYR